MIRAMHSGALPSQKPEHLCDSLQRSQEKPGLRPNLCAGQVWCRSRTAELAEQAAWR